MLFCNTTNGMPTKKEFKRRVKIARVTISAEFLANGSPAREIREITSLGGLSVEENQQATEAGEIRRKNIGKHRGEQKKYIQKHQNNTN